MDVRITTVDALDRRGTLAADQRTDELLENSAPVDDGRNRPTNLGRDLVRNVAPPTRLLVGLGHSLFDDGLDLSLDVFTKLIGNFAPTFVVVHFTEDVPVSLTLTGLTALAFAGTSADDDLELLAGHFLCEVMTLLLHVLLNLREVELRRLHLRKLLDDIGKSLRSSNILGLHLRNLFRVQVGTSSRDKTDARKKPGTGNVVLLGRTGGRLDDRVDRAVSADVPQTRGRLDTADEVTVSDVAELMDDDAVDCVVRFLTQELRVVPEHESVHLDVIRDHRGGNVHRGNLGDVTRQLRPEGVLRHEDDQVPVEVEVGFTASRRFHISTLPCLWWWLHCYAEIIRYEVDYLEVIRRDIHTAI